MAKDGANPNENNLFTAAKAGKLDLIKDILNSGTNVNAKDDRGMTALHHAALGGHPDVVKELLDRGADVNAKNQMGVPVMIYAGQANSDNHRKVLRLLREAEFNLKYPNAEKQEAKAEEVKPDPIIPSHASQPRRLDQIKEFFRPDKDEKPGKKGPKGPRGG